MEDKSEKKLIKETVKNKLRAGTILRRAILAAVFAFIFGVVAALAFTVSRPMWENMMTEEVTTTSIKIFENTTEATAEVTTEAITEAITEATAEVTTEATTEADVTTASAEPATEETVETSEAGTISPAVKEYVSDKIDSKLTLAELYAEYKKAAQTASKSIVSITSTDKTDILDKQVSVESESCGVVIAVTNTDVYILMPAEDVPDSGEMYVSLSGGAAPAQLQGTDKVFGIAVIKVDASDIPEENSDIAAIAMGSSSLVGQGTPVAALGKPTGINGSVVYGMVAYQDSNVQGVDGMIRVFQTDMTSCDDSRGILINSSGELIGVISDEIDGYSDKGYLTAIGLYDLQHSIETLSNGKKAALLGVQGQTVARTLYEEQGIPVGAYVTKVLSGCPAEEEGIIAGDVIVGIDDKEVLTYAGLTAAINSYEAGTEVKVTVMRNNRETWKELEFMVTLGSR